METPTDYVGTWDEIKSHEEELKDRFLVVRIIDDPVVRERIERFERGYSMVREFGRGLGPFARREITLDVLYPDEDEPR